MCKNTNLRGFEKGSDYFKNVSVASRGVVESRGINQNYTAAVQIKSIRELYIARAGFQSIANAKAGSADEIDKLCKSRSGQGEIRDELSLAIHRSRLEQSQRGEIAYRGFSALYRTHDAIRPSGLIYRSRLVGSKGFVQGHRT